MNRRNFLGLFAAGVAGIALEQAIPLGRVWSFPKEIVIPELSLTDLRGEFLEPATRQLANEIDEAWFKQFPIGTAIRVRVPQRFIIRDYIGDFTQPKHWKTVILTQD